MEASFFTRHPGARDGLNFLLFVSLVFLGVIIINSFIFRSFNVVGRSMEDTLHDGDRLIVNRLPVTIAALKNQSYIPKRGEIIVFKNPQYVVGGRDQYIVKRVIAFAGERVVVRDGHITVFNNEQPKGFDPDALSTGGTPRSPTSGDIEMTVADGTIFVSGDHRDGNYSYDSRSGLGTVPYYDIVGPVGARIWPLNKFSTYPSS
jgi:signal peptidase I